MTTTRIRSALALTLALTGTGYVMAPATSEAQTDQVVHPSSACHWELEDTGEPQKFAQFTSNGVWHADTAVPWRLIVCGIDRFNLTNTTGLRDLDIRLRGPGLSTVSVNCEVRSSRPDGTIVKAVNQTNTFSGAHRLDFNGALDMSVAYGAYSVECTLPPLTTLNNILQREY